jgi:hypothetical protein
VCFNRFTAPAANGAASFPERRIPTVADRSALKRLGLGLAALAVAVTLMGAAVVKQHIDSQPTLALAGSPAIEVAVMP